MRWAEAQQRHARLAVVLAQWHTVQQLAARFGVSESVIRNDLSAIRKRGVAIEQEHAEIGNGRRFRLDRSKAEA